MKKDTNIAAEVVSIEAGGPAADAGVRVGDLILAIEDHNIETIDDLHRYLAKHPPGKPLTLTIFRKNELVNTRVIPGEA